MIHDQPHPWAGKEVTVGVDGREVPYLVEDWWDRVSGSSWQIAVGNPAAIQYAIRGGLAGTPADDEVVYGKIANLGYIVHVSEIKEGPTE